MDVFFVQKRQLACLLPCFISSSLNLSLLSLPLDFVSINTYKKKMLGKRKASLDNMMTQPPAKRLMTDGPTGAMTANSLSLSTQGPTVGYAATQGVTETGVSSASHGLQHNENMLRTSGRRDMTASQAQKSSVVLDQAWKEDLDAAHLLPSLFECFGERMFSFTPSPELSFFL